MRGLSIAAEADSSMRRTHTPDGPWELSTVSTELRDGDRRGISADERDRTQQYRVLQAVLRIASVGGYDSLSVAQVMRTSGVTRRGFNTAFASLEDAFVAAHDRCMEQLIDAVRAAIDVDDPPERQLRRGLEAAVAYLVADPARADAMLIEVHVAGHRARRQHETAVQQLTSEARGVLVRCGLETAMAERLASLGIGAVREAIRSRMSRGELHTLPAVTGDLADAAFPLGALDLRDGPPAIPPMPLLAA